MQSAAACGSSWTAGCMVLRRPFRTTTCHSPGIKPALRSRHCVYLIELIIALSQIILSAADYILRSFIAFEHVHGTDETTNLSRNVRKICVLVFCCDSRKANHMNTTCCHSSEHSFSRHDSKILDLSKRFTCHNVCLGAQHVRRCYLGLTLPVETRHAVWLKRCSARSASAALALPPV